jgi:hypothetical protein
LCDIIAHTQTDMKGKNERKRENLTRFAGFACNILVYNIEQ